ncbi:MAG: sortase [Clostridia bacterium]|nr:sortase [Clostridia bacterium]
MAMGAVFILAALSLFLWNRQEDSEAGTSAQDALAQVIERIEMPDGDSVTDYPDPYDPEMTVVEIDGYGYIGYLSIPAIGLELPVMSQWDYDRLKIAPCRYAGACRSEDLVVCAHNYSRHFGTIRNLANGDKVYFTDMDGVVWQYEVEAVEILAPTDIQNMTAGEYALTLFTCTYGGASRVTVRCTRI